jgi:hypothetical protein
MVSAGAAGAAVAAATTGAAGGAAAEGSLPISIFGILVVFGWEKNEAKSESESACCVHVF